MVHLFFGVILLFGIGLIIWLRNYAMKKAKEMVNNEFNNKADDIEKLVKEKNEEFQLRHNKKILIVTPDYSNEDHLKKFMQKMDFKIENIKYQPFKPTIDITENYDIVIFNDENGLSDSKSYDYQEQKNGIEEYLSKFPEETMPFYFGKKHIENINKNSNKIIAFVNTRTQLYGNLMNALRYQDKLM
jgi:hypothetical protein